MNAQLTLIFARLARIERALDRLERALQPPQPDSLAVMGAAARALAERAPAPVFKKRWHKWI